MGWSFCYGWVVVRPGRRGGAPRSESKNPMIAGGNHTLIQMPPALHWEDENITKQKIPGALWLQGRIVDPRYHPACPFGGATSGSTKPYPGNGGNRVPLLRPCPFTGPTQEPDLRAQSTGSHRPPALWSMETGRIFPSMSFRCIQLTLKHKQTGLSTSLE